ncbi:hypothetical protein [Ruthenibacterium intestinale]|uniref:hypothetical protein n=1 Tax=Ruthenibacterium intestinale TaxID=3133163 RepID=UPI0032BFFEA8
MPDWSFSKKLLLWGKPGKRQVSHILTETTAKRGFFLIIINIFQSFCNSFLYHSLKRAPKNAPFFGHFTQILSNLRKIAIFLSILGQKFPEGCHTTCPAKSMYSNYKKATFETFRRSLGTGNPQIFQNRAQFAINFVKDNLSVYSKTPPSQGKRGFFKATFYESPAQR